MENGNTPVIRNAKKRKKESKEKTIRPRSVMPEVSLHFERPHAHV